MATNGNDEARDTTGRFRPGHRGGPGRPKGITAALRRLVDPEAVAELLNGIALGTADGDWTPKDRLRALELITDRLEGKAVSTVDMNVTNTAAPVAFPADWDRMNSGERSRWLDHLPPLELEAGDDAAGDLS